MSHSLVWQQHSESTLVQAWQLGAWPTGKSADSASKHLPESLLHYSLHKQTHLQREETHNAYLPSGIAERAVPEVITFLKPFQDQHLFHLLRNITHCITLFHGSAHWSIQHSGEIWRRINSASSVHSEQRNHQDWKKAFSEDNKARGEVQTPRRECSMNVGCTKYYRIPESESTVYFRNKSAPSHEERCQLDRLRMVKIRNPPSEKDMHALQFSQMLWRPASLRLERWASQC